jgi:LmbE family N-acetylglucosaminyl deacetylase
LRPQTSKTRGLSQKPFAGLHVMLVAAHADDEVLGAGAQFSSMAHLSLVHLTDGAPSLRDARSHGFGSRAAYTAARWQEVEAAAAAGGVSFRHYSLGFRDQHLAFNLVAAADALAPLLVELRPDVVLTHAYEGGHPDHDAAAFVVAAAVKQMGGDIPIWEMTGYNAGPGEVQRGKFLPHVDRVVTTTVLSEDDVETKSRMLSCFRSQQNVIDMFAIGDEEFRLAPEYDFASPPHPGRLMYEMRRRAWRGWLWRVMARQANRELLELGRNHQTSRGAAVFRRLREAVWATWVAV